MRPRKRYRDEEWRCDSWVLISDIINKMSIIHRPSHTFVTSDGYNSASLVPEQSINHPNGVRLSQMTFVNAFPSFPAHERSIAFEIRWLTGSQGAVSYVTRSLTLALDTDVRYTSSTVVSRLNALVAKHDVDNGYTDNTADHLTFNFHADENVLLWETTGVVNVNVNMGNKRLGYPDKVMGNVAFPSSDHIKSYTNTFSWGQNYTLNQIPQSPLDAFALHVDLFESGYQMYLARSNLLYIACSLASNASVHTNLGGAFAGNIICSVPLSGSYGDVVAFNNISQMPVNLSSQWITFLRFTILDDDLNAINMDHSWQMCVELYYRQIVPV